MSKKKKRTFSLGVLGPETSPVLSQQLRLTADSEASSGKGRGAENVTPVDEALLDVLEDDFRTPQRGIRRIRSQSGGLASTLEGDVRCSSADATTAAASNAVRAAHVEFCQSVHRICTDTDSSMKRSECLHASRSVPVTQVRAPDSHDERLDRVRNEVPRDRRQESNRQQPIFSWIWQVVLVRVPEPTTFRESVGIRSRESLAEWIYSEGFPQPRWGAHFSGRVQERILNMAIVRDVRAVAFESVYVQVAVHACQQVVRLQDSPHHGTRRSEPEPQESRPSSVTWESLDHISVNDVFTRRFGVLQNGAFERPVATISHGSRSTQPWNFDWRRNTRTPGVEIVLFIAIKKARVMLAKRS